MLLSTTASVSVPAVVMRRAFGLRTLIQSSKPCKALAEMETSGCLDVLVICVPDMHAKLAGVQIEGERERENEQELQGNKQTHGFAGPPTILLPLEEVLHLGSLLLGLLRRAVRLTYALGNSGLVATRVFWHGPAPLPGSRPGFARE